MNTEEKFWNLIRDHVFYDVRLQTRKYLSSIGRANPFDLRELKLSELTDEKSGITQQGEIDSLMGLAEWIGTKIDKDPSFFSGYYKRTADGELLNSTASCSKNSGKSEMPMSIDSSPSQQLTDTKSNISKTNKFPGASGSNLSQNVEKINYNGSSIFDLLLEANEHKLQHGSRCYKFPEVLKDWSAYTYILGGKDAYDFLQLNLPVPSKLHVRRHIHNMKTISEGQFRIKDLKIFLQSQGFPSKIWLSDLSTAIITRIRYDNGSDQVIGFVLPIDDSNGMPKFTSFSASSAKAIQNIFKSNIPAKLLYTVTAQPLQENAPFFCLLMFGTDDDYDYTVVQKRWKYIKSCLEKEGIEVVGQSTDGDARAFKVMRLASELIYGDSPSISGISEFKARLRASTVHMQDTVHLSTKLKARLVKSDVILILGNSTAHVTYLRVLVNSVSRDKHGLTFEDIFSVDKTNFQSVLKICHPRVLQCLEKYVPGSEGLRQYLRLIYLAVYAIFDDHLAIEKRIYYIWYCNFFLRLWRAWLIKKKLKEHSLKDFSLENSFITLNNYICVEINAHGLFNMILKHIDNNSFDEFFPYMYGSQPYDSFYRLLKSFTSRFHTIENCDLLETTYRMKKVEFLTQITNKTYEEHTAIFTGKSQFRPLFDRLDGKINSNLPNIPEDLPKIGTTFDSPESKSTAEQLLTNVLTRAKLDAFRDIQKLGMEIDIAEANNIQVNTTYDKETDIDDVNEIFHPDVNFQVDQSEDEWECYDGDEDKEQMRKVALDILQNGDLYKYDSDEDPGEKEDLDEEVCTCHGHDRN